MNANGLNQNVTRKPRFGCMQKGCGCLIICVAAFLLVGIGADKWEQRKQQRAETEALTQQQSFNREMRQFGMERAPGLIQSIDELKQLQSDINGRLKKLKALLTKMKKPLDEDADYKAWEDQLADVQKAQTALWDDLQNAYLVYQKYIITPDDAQLEDKLEQALKQGSQAAAGVQERYQKLRDTMSSSD